MTAERLQKVLARAGIGSRRKVEEMIREGRITVDGRLAELGERVDLGSQAVKVDGRRVQAPGGEPCYVLVNKPGGYVSTVSDPEGRPTVLDLLPQRLRHGLKPVGRLDYATEGLLLLTDDGDFAQHVAHPRYGCAKTYEVKVKGRPGAAALDQLRHGIVLDGKRTAPAEIRPRTGRVGARESVEASWWTVILHEGRTRQIREMFARAGHPVKRLRRVAIGPLADPRLPRGAWRELTAGEVEALRRRTARAKPAASAPPAKKPSAPRTKPSAPLAKKPSAPRTKPSAPRTKKPSAPRTKPSASRTKKPSAPRTKKPSAPRTKKPSAPRTKKPSAPRAKKPSAPRTKKPSAPRAKPRRGRPSRTR